MLLFKMGETLTITITTVEKFSTFENRTQVLIGSPNISNIGKSNKLKLENRYFYDFKSVGALDLSQTKQ